ncbi:hypothetical protein ACAE110713_23110 [Achromobacter aegrifaciens]
MALKRVALTDTRTASASAPWVSTRVPVSPSRPRLTVPQPSTWMPCAANPSVLTLVPLMFATAPDWVRTATERSAKVRICPPSTVAGGPPLTNSANEPAASVLTCVSFNVAVPPLTYMP